MSSKRLRIGVCGVGSIGFRHAQVLARKGDVDLYLCDSVPARLESARHLGGICNTSDSFEKMLEWEMDGVIIATPEALHVSQGIQACERHIPILLEKPVAENAEQGQALFDVARETGARILVGYVLRYAESMKLVKSLVEQQVIGTPVSFQVMLGAYDTLVFAKSRFSATDRNRLFGDYSHEWDYLAWFLGPIQSVVATSHQSGDLDLTQNPNVVDSILRLENGVTGTVHLDYVQHHACRHITLIGDRGTIEVQAEQCMVKTRLHREGFSRIYSFPEHIDAMMEAQRDHFISVVRAQENPRVTLQEGLQAARVADALILSCSTGTWQYVLESPT